MTRHLCFVALLLSCACSSSDPSPDAAVQKDSGLTPGSDAGSGSGSGSGGAFGDTCTTASDTSTECASGVCTDSFNMFPTPVCSQKCTVLGGTDPSCPNGSMGQKCNMKGYCRP